MTTNIFELFELIGYRDAPGSDDEAVVELPVAPHVVNTNGGLQGGLLATPGRHRGRQARHAPVATGPQRGDLGPQPALPKAGDRRRRRAVARIVHAGKRSMVIQVDIFAVPDDDLAVVATVSFAKIQIKEGNAVKLGLSTPIVMQHPGEFSPWEADAGPDELALIAEAADGLGFHHLYMCRAHRNTGLRRRGARDGVLGSAGHLVVPGGPDQAHPVGHRRGGAALSPPGGTGEELWNPRPAQRRTQ